MAYKTVKASWLIEKFKTMVEPGKEWKYVANGTSEGAVDCSGAFTYWYRQAGSTMYHGSNTMWRKYTIERGRIGEIELVPGMAVFKMRKDGKEPSAYKNDGLGNFYHIGLYIGDNQVIEAKGTNYGCVISKLKDWSHAAKLKYTEYDVVLTQNKVDDSNTDSVTENNSTQTGRVIGGTLNLRYRPDVNSNSLVKIPNNTSIPILAEAGAWYKTKYKNLTGFVMKKYVSVGQSEWIITGSTTNEAALAELIYYANSLGITLNKEVIL